MKQEEMDLIMQPLLGEAVGTLEAKGLKPIAVQFSVLLEDFEAFHVGISKADETGDFVQVMDALLNIASELQKHPKKQDIFMRALDQAFEESRGGEHMPPQDEEQSGQEQQSEEQSSDQEQTQQEEQQG